MSSMMVDPRYPDIATPPTRPATILPGELVVGVCRSCAGTGRYLWTDRTPTGQEIVIAYGPCPDCKRVPR